MTWWTDNVGAVASRERVEKALSLPVGVASPLWLAFGAAASVGVTWWWMTRWTRAVNLEAFAVETLPTAAPVVKIPAIAAPGVDFPVFDAVSAEIPPTPTPVETAAAAPAPTPIEAPAIEAPLVEVAPVPKLEAKPKAVTKPKAEPAPPPEPDDLTRLVGIGPKLADALAARGISRFSQLAAWTAKDLTEIDKALSLKGRAARDAWVAQAKRMASAS